MTAWPEDDSTTGRMSAPYSAGLFALPDLRRVIAYGRSLGLEIEDFHDGGWLTRTGWLTARGTAGALRRFDAALNGMREQQ